MEKNESIKNYYSSDTNEIKTMIQNFNEHKFFGIIVNKLNNISSEKIKLRILDIIKILNSNNIDFLQLKKMIFEGLPDEVPSLRSLGWKMIMNYLPLNINEWEDYIDKKRMGYNDMKEKIITKLELDKLKYEKDKGKIHNSVEVLDSVSNNPFFRGSEETLSNNFLKENKNLNKMTEQMKNCKLDTEPNNSKSIYLKNSNNSISKISNPKTESSEKGLNNKEENKKASITSNTNLKIKKIKKKNTLDHPLNNTNTSKWKTYFDDIELFEEIDKDVRRTRTHMNFFFMPAKSNKHIHNIKNEEISDLADKKRNEPSYFQDNKNKASFDSNADLMCRILFIYAKKYPEVRYVQGMNEILAPILYCFSNDQNPYFYLNVEADTYICFENFMNEIKEIFIRSLDNTETGIQTRLKNLYLILRVFDRDLYNHLSNEKVELQYFAFRWYTLFFTQEFEMPDVLRLWDSLLSEDEKFDFINMICIAIIKIKRQEILQNDFAGIMTNIQNFEKIEVENIIKFGLDLRAEINRQQFN